MATSGVSSTSNTVLDQYIDAYIATQQYRYEPLDKKSEQLELKQQFFTQLNGKLNGLLSAVDAFGTLKNVEKTDANGNTTTTREFVKTKDIDSKFVTRKVTTSSNDFLTATAKGSALVGTNNVKVMQLASADNYIGKQVNIVKTPEYEADGTTIKKDANGNNIMKGGLDNALKANLNGDTGTLSFKVKIGDDERTISVEYNSTDTNESVMKAITTQLNESEDNGGFGDKINTAFVKDSSGTARLTLTSKATGEDNAISFEVDNANTQNKDALNIFGIENTTTRGQYNDGTAASYGFQKAALTDLNSKINLNGVTVTRSSNTIDDAIDGVTLNLKKVNAPEDAPTSLNTDIDPAAVTKLLDPLITSFNGMTGFILQNKTAHGNDSSMMTLGNALRSMLSEDISKYADTSAYSNEDTQPIKYLAELGFSVSSTDGTLSLSDTSKFEKILKNDDGPKLIADAINGFAARISEYLDNLSSRDGNTGIIKSRLSSINQQIETNNKKITQVDNSILKMAETQRKQYTAYLSAYYNAQNQAALISTFGSTSSSGGNAYDSLISQQAANNNSSSS